MDLERLYIVQVKTKLRNSPYTETTHNLGTVSYEADELYSGSAKIAGIVVSVSSINRTIGRPVPTRRGVGITLTDARGSWGLDKRFKDLLEKQEIIEQDLLVYTFKKSVGAVGSSGQLKLEFTGKVKSARFLPQAAAVELSAEPDGMPKAIPQTIIDPAVSSFASAPDKNIARPLPIVFGQAQIPARLVGGTAADAEYALCTTGGTDYPIKSLDTVYAKNKSGEYVEVSNPTGANTSLPWSQSAYTTNIDYINGDQEGFEFAQQFTPTHGAILVSIGTTLYATASNWDGVLSCAIYENDESQDVPGQRIGFGDVELQGSVSPPAYRQTDTIYFREPIVLEANRTYYLSFRMADNSRSTASVGSLYLSGDNSASDVTTWKSTGAGDPKGWGTGATFNDKPFQTTFSGAGFTATLSDADNYAHMLVDQYNDVIEEPDLRNLSLVCDITGLTDDSSGTITGTASKTLDNAAEAAGYLLEQCGCSYDLTTFDTEAVLDSSHARAIGGASSGRQSVENILAAVFKNSACVGYRDTSGAFVVWPYGYQQGTIHKITEADCRLISWEVFGPETVVTHTDFGYRKLSIPLPLEQVQAGDSTSYAKYLEEQNSDGGNPGSWTEESYNIYGDLRVSNNTFNLDWIYDDASASFLSEYYLKVFSRPTEIVKIELPYFERNYRDIELMDIIELEHIDNPNDSGTSPDGFTKYPVYSGVAHEEITSSFPWRMAKKYPMRVLSKTLRGDFSLELELKVLNNPKEIY